MLSPREAMLDFLQSLKGTDRKPATLIYYRSSLRQLIGWMEEAGKDLADLNARTVRRYFADREEKDGVSRTTQYHDWTCSRAFFRYCRRQGWMEGDPMGELRFRKPRPKPVDVPADRAVLALLKAVGDRWNPKLNPKARYTAQKYRTRIQRRDYCILLALFETGARRGEILNLALFDVKAVDTASPYLALRNTKTNEDRPAFVTSKWVEAYRAYLRVRPSTDCDRLFIGEYGERLSASWFTRKLAAYAAFAGIEPLTPQALRRYRSSKLVQSKTDLHEASLILGNSPAVLQAHYLDRDPIRLRQKWEASLSDQPIESTRKKRQRA